MIIRCIDISSLLSQVQGTAKALGSLGAVIKEADEADIIALKAEIKILNKELELRTSQRDNGRMSIERLNDLVYRTEPDDDQGETWMEYAKVLLIENLELRNQQGKDE